MFFVISGSPGGIPGRSRAPGHVFVPFCFKINLTKIGVFVSEGCTFPDSGFSGPVREVTFSDFLLGYSGRDDPVGETRQ